MKDGQMDRERLKALARAKGVEGEKGTLKIDIDTDLKQECRYVDFLLASSLKTGKCAKLLRNYMIIYAAKIPQRANGRDYIFEPEGICQTIKVLEGHEVQDITRGPFRYEKGPLTGLYKKHFFQASFLVNNILLELQKNGAGIIYRKLTEYYGRGNFMGKPMEEIDAQLIAEAFSRDVVERRAAGRSKNWRGGLTGEHLIYAASASGNVYLYPSYHDEPIKEIAEGVRVSLQDFPELKGTAPVFE